MFARNGDAGPRHKTFKERLRYQFLTYTLLPLVLLIVLFFGFFVLNTHAGIRRKTTDANSQIVANLTAEATLYEAFLPEYAAQPEVAAYFTRGGNTSALYKPFYAFYNGVGLKCSLHLIDAQGNLLLSSRPLSPASLESFGLFVFPRMARSEGPLFCEMTPLTYQNGQSGLYLLAAPVQQGGQKLGYVLLLLDREGFQGAANVPENEVCIITDRFDTAMVATDSNFVNRYNKIATQIPAGAGNLSLGGIDYYVVKTHVPLLDLWVYTGNATTTSQKLFPPLLAFLAGLVLLFFALVWVLSGKIANSTGAAVAQMIDAVRHTRNAELDYRVDIRTNDEFQTLGEQFNKMQEKIENLLRNNEELVDLRRQAEVKQLESQFNPHFIFNVLETLRYALYFDKDVAQQIIASLSHILKYSVYSDHKESALADDLRYIEEYLKLHQIRLGDKIQYIIDIEDGLEFALVPKLILQPIVENSVKYGYNRHNALSLLLKITAENGRLLMQVTDDGGGVSQQQYNLLLADLTSPDIPANHTGLYNINKRLHLMYGNESGVSITNVEGESFSVLVHMPLKKMK